MTVIATYYVDFLTVEHQSNTTSYETVILFILSFYIPGIDSN